MATKSLPFTTETVLQNVRVLAIDDVRKTAGHRVMVSRTATLEVTPEQAEIITVAQQMADPLAWRFARPAGCRGQDIKQADYLVSSIPAAGRSKVIKSGSVTK